MQLNGVSWLLNSVLVEEASRVGGDKRKRLPLEALRRAERPDRREAVERLRELGEDWRA